jgi:hypothetical protein
VQFIVKLPDELARQVIPVGSDPARVAVEDMAVEAYAPAGSQNISWQRY